MTSLENGKVSRSGRDSEKGGLQQGRHAKAPLENPDIVRAFHAVLAGALNTPAIAATVGRLNRESAAEIASAISAGVKAKTLRSDINPAIEGVVILATMRGVIAQWLIDPSIDLKRTGAAFVSALKKRLIK